MHSLAIRNSFTKKMDFVIYMVSTLSIYTIMDCHIKLVYRKDVPVLIDDFPFPAIYTFSGTRYCFGVVHKAVDIQAVLNLLMAQYG